MLAVEVVCVGTGASYLFACGQWLSLEKGHSIVEKNYESGEIRVGAILKSVEKDASAKSKSQHVLRLEALHGSETDLRVSLLIDQPEIRKPPILYRFFFQN